jgi:hypothetical protein
MSYVADICLALARVLEQASFHKGVRLAGYAANADYWASKVRHVLDCIAGYDARFRNVKDARVNYATNFWPPARPLLDHANDYRRRIGKIEPTAAFCGHAVLPLVSLASQPSEGCRTGAAPRASNRRSSHQLMCFGLQSAQAHFEWCCSAVDNNFQVAYHWGRPVAILGQQPRLGFLGPQTRCFWFGDRTKRPPRAGRGEIAVRDDGRLKQAL